MILIRLFPFVYADYIDNKILLYDTLQSSVMIEEFEGKVKLKNRINLLLFDVGLFSAQNQWFYAISQKI